MSKKTKAAVEVEVEPTASVEVEPVEPKAKEAEEAEVAPVEVKPTAPVKMTAKDKMLAAAALELVEEHFSGTDSSGYVFQLVEDYPLSNLLEVENVRDADRQDIVNLAADIDAVGQREHISANVLDDAPNVARTLQGHRRAAALRYLNATTARVKVYHNLTPAQEMDLKIDSGNTIALRTPTELYRAVRMLRAAGISAEPALVARLGGLIDSIHPNAKLSAEVAELREKGENKRADARSFVGRRGVIQKYTRLMSLPPIVSEAWANSLKLVLDKTHAFGELPEVKTTDLVDLAKALRADKDADAKLDNPAGVDRYKVGANYKLAWQKVKENSVVAAAAAANGEKAAKAMSAKAMLGELKSGTYLSEVVQLTLKMAAGANIDKARLVALDADARLFADAVELAKSERVALASKVEKARADAQK